jgi:hypothetical protein
VLKAYDNDNKTTYCQGHLSSIVHNFMTFEHSQLKSLLEQSKKKNTIPMVTAYFEELI